ncbi:MAG: ribonuclease HI, partial [Bacteroidales bacterium]
MSHRITIYTDGAARGNPGPGGYGVVLLSGKHRKELSGGYRKTTNNRMELLAVIKGFEAMKNKGNKITLYTDSKYIADAVNKGWVFNWEEQNFKKKKNVDLWT